AAGGGSELSPGLRAVLIEERDLDPLRRDEDPVTGTAPALEQMIQALLSEAFADAVPGLVDRLAIQVLRLHFQGRASGFQKQIKTFDLILEIALARFEARD